MTREESLNKVDFCRCGRAMTVITLDKKGDGFEKVCPKFNRSWRNLWMGGVSHEGKHYFPYRLNSLEGDYGCLAIIWRGM